MGSSFANIFVDYYEFKLFDTTSKLAMYYCYMDECIAFIHSLNLFHPSLRFIFGKESNLSLSFLDVLVEILLRSSSLPFTGNPHSSVNIYLGIPSVYKNAKPTKS